MEGKTHALSGAVAYVGIAPLLHHATVWQIGVGAVATAGAALIPDLDQKQATASRTLGPVTWLISWVVRHISGGHRHGTHTLLGTALAAGLAGLAARYDYAAAVLLWLLGSWAVRAFRRRDPWPERLIIAAVMAAGAWWLAVSHSFDAWFLPLSAGLGILAHLLGDAATEQGLKPLRPFSNATVRIGWIDTGEWVETWLVYPALWLALGYLTWRATGPALMHTITPIYLTGGSS